ncbi:hypothetical protein M430DRAFT_38594 [Amorphotheca resinae ATCC 22711]|uniref:Uncharacterized protein n=1 Tax=Amorphotheca resinae ATCC 22711 TaxID=857342 RepID=A0A2T3BER8_AMORE|nr:hypothetical protein M430DRAFT_38594 [Amorphotheca resinae ATCC 22711]PSS27874.1 hypothetical protein M430DRAFT_38594 [Amorphotheca resinae ATCC 22711]
MVGGKLTAAFLVTALSQAEANLPTYRLGSEAENKAGAYEGGRGAAKGYRCKGKERKPTDGACIRSDGRPGSTFREVVDRYEWDSSEGKRATGTDWRVAAVRRSTVSIGVDWRLFGIFALALDQFTSLPSLALGLLGSLDLWPRVGTLPLPATPHPHLSAAARGDWLPLQSPKNVRKRGPIRPITGIQEHPSLEVLYIRSKRLRLLGTEYGMLLSSLSCLKAADPVPGNGERGTYKMPLHASTSGRNVFARAF